MDTDPTGMDMDMDSGDVRRERLRLKLPQQLTLKQTPGTTTPMPTIPMPTPHTTDPMVTTVMGCGAARREKQRLSLLLKLTRLPTQRLTPGTTMEGPTMVDTMATDPMATMDMDMDYGAVNRH